MIFIFNVLGEGECDELYAAARRVCAAADAAAETQLKMSVLPLTLYRDIDTIINSVKESERELGAAIDDLKKNVWSYSR